MRASEKLEQILKKYEFHTTDKKTSDVQKLDYKDTIISSKQPTNGYSEEYLKRPSQIFEKDLKKEKNNRLRINSSREVISKTNKPNKEEINYLYEYISLLKKQINERSDDSFVRNSLQKIENLSSQQPQTGNLRIIDILEYRNQKLERNLEAANENVERLYKELQLMGDQLNIYQKRYENYPVYDLEADMSQNQAKKLVKKLEKEFQGKWENISKTIENLQDRLQKITAKQLKLNKQILLSSEKYEKVCEENQNLKKMCQESENLKNFSKNYENIRKTEKKAKIEPQDNSEKIEEYKIEIFQLGLQMLKMQEKHEKEVLTFSEKIKKLQNENIQLIDDLSSSAIKNSSLTYDDSSPEAKKSLIFSALSIKTNLHKHSNPSNKSEEKIKINKDYKKHFEYLNEIHNDQIQKLDKECKDMHDSYSSLELLLFKTQENLKSSEESRKNLEKNAEKLVKEIDYLKKTLENRETDKEIRLFQQEKHELEAKTEDITKKYHRLLLEFKTNENLLEKYQDDISKCKKVINDQEKTIESLQSKITPYVEQEKTENLLKKLEEEKQDLKKFDENINNFEGKNVEIIKNLNNLIEEKNLIILDLQSQIIVITNECESAKNELEKVIEGYQSSKSEYKQLEHVLEDLQFELMNQKI